jgi:hypothetical protein
MAEEHVRKNYKFQGEIRERHYISPNTKQNHKEGDVFVVKNKPASRHHNLAGEKVKVLARYYTLNYYVKNYGMVVEIQDGTRKGKIYHVPSIF